MVGKSRPHAAQMYRKTKRAKDVGQLQENKMGFLYIVKSIKYMRYKMKDTKYYTHYKGEFIEVLPIEKCINSILCRIESYEDTIKRLKEENRKLKDEVWKDEELQDMKEQLDKMKSNYHRGFNITEEEDTAIKEWKKKHEEEVHGLTTPMARVQAQGASGGRYSYIFYPTAIGCAGVVKCNACGEEFVFSHLG